MKLTRKLLLTGFFLLVCGAAIGAVEEQQYQYRKDIPFKVSCATGQITKLKLEPGELVTGKPVISDKFHWKVGKTDGFIYVEPSAAGRFARLMIPTNKRTYLIDLSSDNETPMSLVSWSYELEKESVKETPAQAAVKEKPLPVIKQEPWLITEGDTLKNGLTKWVKREGWSYLSWELNRDYPIIAPISVNGNFQTSLEAVLTAYHNSATPLYSCLKTGNKVVIISDKPLNDRCLDNPIKKD